MLDQFQAVAHFEREFPRIRQHAEPQGAPRLEDLDFARLVIQLHEEGDSHALRVAFALLEIFLSDGNRYVREWVGHSIENLHDLASWKPCGREVFLPFLGALTCRIWTALDRICEAAVGSDLRDTSVFEAELATWHVVRDAIGRAGAEYRAV
jgi:hypothetical protein